MKQPKCHHCGEVIGVYEPVTVISGDNARNTSRAAEPGLPGEVYHHTCYLAVCTALETRAA